MKNVIARKQFTMRNSEDKVPDYTVFIQGIVSRLHCTGGTCGEGVMCGVEAFSLLTWPGYEAKGYYKAA